MTMSQEPENQEKIAENICGMQRERGRWPQIEALRAGVHDAGISALTRSSHRRQRRQRLAQGARSAPAGGAG
jgi:hypothetical protein